METKIYSDPLDLIEDAADILIEGGVTPTEVWLAPDVMDSIIKELELWNNEPDAENGPILAITFDWGHTEIVVKPEMEPGTIVVKGPDADGISDD